MQVMAEYNMNKERYTIGRLLITTSASTMLRHGHHSLIINIPTIRSRGSEQHQRTYVNGKLIKKQPCSMAMW